MNSKRVFFSLNMYNYYSSINEEMLSLDGDYSVFLNDPIYFKRQL